MDYLFSARSFIRYLLIGKTKYYIHSPFVFEFIQEVLLDNRNFYCYDEVENLRKILKHSSEIIEVEDFGAGSSAMKASLYDKAGQGKMRKVKEIVSAAPKPAKYAQLLFRIASYYKSKNILELGTSLGLTTLYLSSPDEKSIVVTLEGSVAISKIAAKNFKATSRTNIQLIEGNFDETLSKSLNEFSHLDLVFFDGNHRKEPTLNYFHQCLSKVHNDSIFIFDDIYWSHGMANAWNEIKAHPQVTLTVDLFQLGIVFFRKENRKEHFTLYF